MLPIEPTTGSRTEFLEFLRRRHPGLDAEPALSAESGLSALWRSGLVAAGELADAAAAHFQLPRGDGATVSQRPHHLQNLSRRFLREQALFPFDDDGRPALATADPTATEAIDAVRLALGAPAPLVLVSFEEIELLFEQAGGERSTAQVAELAALARAEPAAGPRDDPEALQDLARGAPIIRAIDQILERALDVGATDVHLETGREQLRVRLRVDGLLREDQTLPRHLAAAVISRVKILAGLDIAERRLPQDGRANLVIGGAEADLRVAIMPTMYGETAVLRILLRETRLLDLARIGMAAADRRAIEALLAEPHGLIIITGPTGSGKTTTLATAMSMLNQPSRKIVTVEDPIEYQLPGLHQTQIKPAIGLTFATALRSFLRHDPDIIMVGEMRDRETAGIGIQAALTGHLVLTTLHTNTAADAVIRLADMGVEPYLIASSLRGVVGQRLVRRLCERCRVPDPGGAEQARRLCGQRGLALPFAGEGAFHTGVGCAVCGQTGHRGRIGIFEAMTIDDDIRGLIRKDLEPDVIEAAARRSGMTSLFEDGMSKAAAGQTSIAEILRASG